MILKLEVTKTITRKELYTLEIDTEKITPEQTLIALELNNSNFNNFIEETGIELPQKTELISDTFKSKIKVKNKASERRDAFYEADMKVYNKTIIGNICFSVEGTGSNYAYQSGEMRGKEEFPVSTMALDEIFKDKPELQKHLKLENEKYIISHELIVEYLKKYYDAPSEIEELSYEGDEPHECMLLYWIQNLEGVLYQEHDADRRFSEYHFQWTLSFESR